MTRLVAFFLTLLLTTPALAAPGDWTACFPLAAGTCAKVTDVLFEPTATLTSSGSLPANRCVMATTGLLCEGATADGIETLVTVADPTSTDKTITFPNTTGTVLTTGDTATITATMLGTDSVGSDEIAANAVGASEIANPVRSIPLPLTSWAPCVDFLFDAAGADDDPDLVNTPAGTVAIEYDDAANPDTEAICTSFVVPTDYASGGAFRVRMTADGATVTQVETFSCLISVDGAAAGSANAGNAANQTAVQTVTSTPTGTWAAGASIQVACKQGNATPDDTVTFHGIEAFYTATQ